MSRAHESYRQTTDGRATSYSGTGKKFAPTTHCRLYHPQWLTVFVVGLVLVIVTVVVVVVVVVVYYILAVMRPNYCYMIIMEYKAEVPC